MLIDPPSLTLFPVEGSAELAVLQDKSFELATAAARLGGSLHPIVRQAVSDMVRSMNCYYSNRIEGHDTLPHDIDRALRGDFAPDSGKRNRQIEALAHIEVQAMIDQGRLDGLRLGVSLVRELHKQYCDRLPDELLWIEHRRTKERFQVIPGEWRGREVPVGRHMPVPPEMLPAFMAHFDDGYSRSRPSMGVIAAASAHHRLLWIRPFPHGNGRIARLHSPAFLRRFNVSSDLWSLSRGLAFTLERYKAALARADHPPQASTDVRTPLSGRGLAAFVDYFIETCADEVATMSGLLDPAGFLERLRTFVQLEAAARRLDAKAYDLLARMFTDGEVSRSAIPGMLGVSDRHARRIIEPLLARGLIRADNRSLPYRLAFPLTEVGVLFPRLFALAHDEAALVAVSVPNP